MTQLPILQKFLIVIKNRVFTIDFSEYESDFVNNDFYLLNLYESMRKIITSYSDEFKFLNCQTENFKLSFEYNQTQIILKCKLENFNSKKFQVAYDYDQFEQLFLNNKFFVREVESFFYTYIRNSFNNFLEEELDKKFQQFSDRFIFEKLKNLHN